MLSTFVLLALWNFLSRMFCNSYTQFWESSKSGRYCTVPCNHSMASAEMSEYIYFSYKYTGICIRVNLHGIADHKIGGSIFGYLLCCSWSNSSSFWFHYILAWFNCKSSFGHVWNIDNVMTVRTFASVVRYSFAGWTLYRKFTRKKLKRNTRDIVKIVFTWFHKKNFQLNL